jgi:hypothetical protein
MIRILTTLVTISILSGCAYRVAAEDVQLMPASAARSILEKWYGSTWVASPEVQGSGFADACNTARKRVAFSDFVGASYAAPIGVQPAALTLVIADGRWTTCAYVKAAKIPSLEEARQVVAAVNSLGGRIEKFTSNCGVPGVSCNMGTR